MIKNLFIPLMVCLFLTTGRAQYSIPGKTDWAMLSLVGKVKDLRESLDSGKSITNWHFTPDGKLEWLSGQHPLMDELFSRDEQGRTIEEIDADTSDTWSKTTTKYETRDRLTYITTLYTETDKTGIPSTPCPMKQVYVYDERGLMIKHTSYGCDTTTIVMTDDYIYDRNNYCTEIHDLQNAVTSIVRFENDRRGNVISSNTFSADGKLVAHLTESYSYTYDANGNYITEARHLIRRGKPVTLSYTRLITYY